MKTATIRNIAIFMREKGLTTLLLFLIIGTVLIAIIISCVQREELESITIHQGIMETKSGHDSLFNPPSGPAMGLQLNNPYSLDLMQDACDSLCNKKNLPHITLDPNFLYVRFLPQDSLEYKYLESQGIELFDFPLDYEMPCEGDYYHAPGLQDSQMTWQYCTLPYSAIIPSISHQVLDTCYIPPTEGPQPSLMSESPDANRGLDDTAFLIELEGLAYSMANPSQGGGLILNDPGYTINSTIPKHPHGYVKVRIDDVDYPVKKVKVRTWNFVKVASTYTTETGYYSIPKGYISNPRYSVKFVNEEGFRIYRTLFEFTPIFKWTQHHSNTGYNMTFTEGKMRRAAMVNNYIYEYFKQCETDGRTMPPKNLNITVLERDPNGYSGGAPMLHTIGASSANYYAPGLAPILGESITAVLLSYFAYWLPDIVIREQESAAKMAECVYHELSHASHFVKAGLSFWGDYINFIIANTLAGDDVYGDGLSNSSSWQKKCELGEAWGFANQRLYQKNVEGIAAPDAGNSQWFSPAITAIYLLVDRGILTEAQILNVMNSSVTSIAGLHSALTSVYSYKSLAITDCFAEAGALPNQTRWRIINDTSGVLDLTLKKNGQTRNRISLYQRDTLLFASHPFADSTFYINNWNHPQSWYYPDTTYFVVNGSMVFQQLNRVTTIPLLRPFNNISQWSYSHQHIDAGNKDIKTYLFTLSNSDY